MKFCEIPAARGVDIGNSLNRLRTLENPIIKRNFTKSFHLGQFEVTQAQYIAIMGEEPWINERGNYRYGAREGENFPANYISHRKALEFTRILSLEETIDMERGKERTFLPIIFLIVRP